MFYFKNLSFYVKTSLAPFWAMLVKIWLLLNLAPGHTGRRDRHTIIVFIDESEILSSEGLNSAKKTGLTTFIRSTMTMTITTLC